MFAKTRRWLFGISTAEVTFEKRGFTYSDDSCRRHFEHIGSVFLQGYHRALETPDLTALGRDLENLPETIRGFSFEGAAMALGLLDLITPWNRNRLGQFLHGPGDKHAYLIYVGFGWAMARLSFNLNRQLNRLDPLYQWLAIDGYGFHQGFFHWRRFIQQKEQSKKISGYGLRAFDQGLGRSLWFVKGADIDAVFETVQRFPEKRHPDLWSGLGLACAYAGGVSRVEIERLRALSGPFWLHLGQGAAFAAKARARAGIQAEHTDWACKTFCEMPAQDAALVADQALGDRATGADAGTYELWRVRVRELIEQAVSLPSI